MHSERRGWVSVTDSEVRWGADKHVTMSKRRLPSHWVKPHSELVAPRR